MGIERRTFGFARLSFGKQSELTVKLDKKEGDAFAIDMDIVPPSETANLPEVTPEQRAGTTEGWRRKILSAMPIRQRL